MIRFGFKPIYVFLRFISEAFIASQIARKVIQSTSIDFKLNTFVPLSGHYLGIFGETQPYGDVLKKKY